LTPQINTKFYVHSDPIFSLASSMPFHAAGLHMRGTP
jgi:hypothetical protein